MRKYMPGIFAILLGAGPSPFTKASKPKITTYYFKNTGPDKFHVTWVYIGANQPPPSDCSVNTNNWCDGTSTSQTGPVTPRSEGDYIGL